MEEKNMEIKNWYSQNFSEFEKKLNGQADSEFHKIRKSALSEFEKLPFPTLKTEDWKYTNIRPILKQNFTPAQNAVPVKVTKELVANYKMDGFECDYLVFVNGIYNKELSCLSDAAKGIVVDSLGNVLKNNSDLVLNKIAKLAEIENPFNALNTAYAVDGTVVYVPKNVVIEKPIQVIFLSGSDDENVLVTPRNLIIAEENSQVKLIFNYEGISSNPYFTNAVTEIYTSKNSVVELNKIQNEDDNSFHIEKTQIYQEDGSNFTHSSISFGGLITRNDINSILDGENVECNYFGLYLANETRHVDHHTFVDHAKPNSVSNELYKGILDDNGHGVFSGKIMVRQDAQKTNAYQSNKSVLLSPDAQVDTKPQLEIYADDVKCSHGATVGHLDDEAKYYIRSRGIPVELANSMLITAFANDVLENIKIPELREKLNHMIFEKLHRVEV